MFDISKIREKYKITEDGKVFRRKENTYVELSQYTDRYGYRCVTLCIEGVKKNRPVHRLVAKEFIGPDNRQVNHIDGNKVNNTIGNLEYVSPGYNLSHAYSIGLKNAQGSNNGRSKLTEEDVLNIRKMLEEGITQSTLSKKFNIHQTTVSNIRTRKLWPHL